eukprot:GGOE01049512.1.p3 GENE.GGOE01049512.1~~GGOE01049512.1.p3  ORF type:complete len:172 (-),score=26.85 GGOE01049512.1:109-558(-)
MAGARPRASEAQRWDRVQAERAWVAEQTLLLQRLARQTHRDSMRAEFLETQMDHRERDYARGTQFVEGDRRSAPCKAADHASRLRQAEQQEAVALSLFDWPPPTASVPSSAPRHRPTDVRWVDDSDSSGSYGIRRQVPPRPTRQVASSH